MDITTLLIIFFAHFVADFVMQSDDMAKNKSKSNKWLLRHTVVYSCLLFLIVGVPGVFDGVPLAMAAIWVLANFALHTVTDYATSRITSKLWKEKRVHDFFVVIGADQFLHAAALILTWKWIILGA